MKFDSLVDCITEVMENLNHKKVCFDDVYFYVNYDGDLKVCNAVDLIYCEEIDKYAFVIRCK